MRILFVSPVSPLPLLNGTSVRIYNIMNQLRRHGHEIGLIAMLYEQDRSAMETIHHWFLDLELITIRSPGQIRNRPPAVSWKRLLVLIKLLFEGTPPKMALTYHPGIEKALSKLQSKYDLIFVELCFMALNYPKQLLYANQQKTVLVEIDISFIAKKRQYQLKRGLARFISWLNFLAWRRSEINIANRFSRIATMSELDQRILKSIFPEKQIIVVPNGADLESIQFTIPKNRNTDHPRLLFVGGLAHRANLDALEYFLLEIFPLLRKKYPQLRLLVAGQTAGHENKLKSLAAQGLDLLGFIPDLTEHFSNCIAFIAPLRIAGGTRLKIVQAMASGIPVISTSIGSEGLQVIDGKHLFIAENASEFLQALERIVNDPKKTEKMIKSARELCEKHYDWAIIVDKMIKSLSGSDKKK